MRRSTFSFSAGSLLAVAVLLGCVGAAEAQRGGRGGSRGGYSSGYRGGYYGGYSGGYGYGSGYRGGYGYPGYYGGYGRGVAIGAGYYPGYRGYGYGSPGYSTYGYVPVNQPIVVAGGTPSTIQRTTSGYTPSNTTGTVTVNVPANAKVWVGNYLTRSTGTMRTFESPELQPGKEYTYKVRATWTDQNGKEVTQTRDVDITAGGNSRLNFPTQQTDG